MGWHLFLDDERDPARPTSDTVVCRTAEEARSEVAARGSPYVMDLDHDLGDGEDAMGFLRWFAEEALDGRISVPEGFSYAVHSQNPVGRANINGFMTGLLRALREEDRPSSPSGPE